MSFAHRDVFAEIGVVVEPVPARIVVTFGRVVAAVIEIVDVVPALLEELRALWTRAARIRACMGVGAAVGGPEDHPRIVRDDRAVF